MKKWFLNIPANLIYILVKRNRPNVWYGNRSDYHDFLYSICCIVLGFYKDKYSQDGIIGIYNLRQDILNDNSIILNKTIDSDFYRWYYIYVHSLISESDKYKFEELLKSDLNSMIVQILKLSLIPFIIIYLISLIRNILITLTVINILIALIRYDQGYLEHFKLNYDWLMNILDGSQIDGSQIYDDVSVKTITKGGSVTNENLLEALDKVWEYNRGMEYLNIVRDFTLISVILLIFLNVLNK